MEIKYKVRQFMGDFMAKDFDKNMNVLGVVYETPSIICYKVNQFETITLCKEFDLVEQKIVLYR